MTSTVGFHSNGVKKEFNVMRHLVHLFHEENYMSKLESHSWKAKTGMPKMETPNEKYNVQMAMARNKSLATIRHMLRDGVCNHSCMTDMRSGWSPCSKMMVLSFGPMSCIRMLYCISSAL